MAFDLLVRMRVFHAVAEGGSFAHAARRLDLSRGMATRHVAQLEAHLGVRLLHRTTRRVSLTGGGADYFERASQILALVDEATRSAQLEASEPRGLLRVTAPAIFGATLLPVAVAQFVQRYPRVQVELAISERVVDLVAERFDVALRIARELDASLISREIVRSHMVACAAPSYLQRHGHPRTPGELATHNCLMQRQAQFRSQWLFERDGQPHPVRPGGNFQADNGIALVGCALAGLGIAYEPRFLVQDLLGQGLLEPVLADWRTPEVGVQAVWASRKFMPPKVRAFVDFLVQRFAGTAGDARVSAAGTPGPTRRARAAARAVRTS